MYSIAPTVSLIIAIDGARNLDFSQRSSVRVDDASSRYAAGKELCTTASADLHAESKNAECTLDA
jgi:hypothetical protein